MRSLLMAATLSACGSLRVSINEPNPTLKPGQWGSAHYEASPVIPFINTNWLWGGHSPSSHSESVYPSTDGDAIEFIVPKRLGLYRLVNVQFDKWSVGVEDESSAPYPTLRDGDTLTTLSSAVVKYGPYVRIGFGELGGIHHVRFITDPRPISRVRVAHCAPATEPGGAATSWWRPQREVPAAPHARLSLAQPGAMRLPIIEEATGFESVEVAFFSWPKLAALHDSSQVLARHWEKLRSEGVPWPSRREGDALVIDVPALPREKGVVWLVTHGGNPWFVGVCALEVVIEEPCADPRTLNK